MLSERDLTGVFVPVVTPFLQDGQLDLQSYRTYVERLSAYEISGLVINGTTGESPTVAWEEVSELVVTAKDVLAAKRRAIPIIVGTGTNDTMSTVKRTEMAGQWGADAVLIVTPYYSRPSQEGIAEHYRRAAQAGVPVIAYEVPSRTAVRMTADTVRNVMDMSGIIGLKDSSGSMELIKELTGKLVKPILCGEDILFGDMLALGAAGGILASANVWTERFVEVHRLAAHGDLQGSKQAFSQLEPLIRKLFRESNPAPLKWLLAKTGVIEADTLRLPMTPISARLQAELEQELLLMP